MAFGNPPFRSSRDLREVELLFNLGDAQFGQIGIASASALLQGVGGVDRLSWEEAYDIIATNMQRLIKEYGNESIYLNYGTGTLGGTMTRSWPPGNTLVARLMNCCGGYLNHYGDYSSAQIAEGLNYTYGGWADGNSPSDIENSKLVVLFGNNPGETRMSGGGVTYYLEQARHEI